MNPALILSWAPTPKSPSKNLLDISTSSVDWCLFPSRAIIVWIPRKRWNMWMKIQLGFMSFLEVLILVITNLSRRCQIFLTSTKKRRDILSPFTASYVFHYIFHPSNILTVDGASGAFVAPFANPKLLWDFKLPRVVSINTSGHKFGLAYVGVGWVVWRDKKHLPKDLIFELHYLGSVEYSFSLNFSRPAAPIIAQYFNLLHLGFEGYRAVAINDLKNARLLSRALENSSYYHVLSDIHRHAVQSAKGEADDEDVEVSIFFND